MALQNGHRFEVSMDEAFPFGLYAMGVEQQMDFHGTGKPKTPAKDKQTGDLVWNVTCIDRDPEARTKQITVKVLGPVCPTLPEEIIPASGIRPVEFSGLTASPWVGNPMRQGDKGPLAYTWRATGVHPQGKAPKENPAGPPRQNEPGKG